MNPLVRFTLQKVYRYLCSVSALKILRWMQRNIRNKEDVIICALHK